MRATILDGTALAQIVQAELRAAVAHRRERGCHPPGLAAVLVGANPASEWYVNAKRRDCERVGIESSLHRLPADASQAQLLELIGRLNADPRVDGILVQLPLPPHFDELTILRAIDPTKDVDGFHPENVGLLATGHPRFVPCTPLGVWRLLTHYQVPLRGAAVVVVGRSNIVGKPLATLLMQKPTRDNPYGGDATVTVCHSATRDLPTLCRQADIVIVAIGQAHFLTADMVKPGVVVVDVGINKLAGQSQPVGDADYHGLQALAAAITPVPGGVGPMTRAMLLANTVQAANARSGGG